MMGFLVDQTEERRGSDFQVRPLALGVLKLLLDGVRAKARISVKLCTCFHPKAQL